MPIDVIKTKMQTNPTLYGDQKLGFYGAASKLIEEEGLSILLQGMGPTLSGYLIQGSLKYGFYEIFKSLLYYQYDFLFVGNKVLLYIISGALAESIGSSILIPFEAARIRIVDNPAYASGGVRGNFFILM